MPYRDPIQPFEPGEDDPIVQLEKAARTDALARACLDLTVYGGSTPMVALAVFVRASIKDRQELRRQLLSLHERFAQPMIVMKG